MIDEEELERILISQNYLVKKKWLKTCIKYLQSSLTIPKNPTTLLNLIIQQFLNSDIGDAYEVAMKIPTHATKLMLTRKMIFQVLSHVQVSNSIYEQFSDATRGERDLAWFHGQEEVLENEREDEPEPKTRKRGMIKVELSDGINHIHAIEICEPIFDLESIVPGMKIILIDKVRCRRGILLLDSSNCQILGGQVEQHNYLPVEKMAKMLKIDLDAETKRKTLANEKAAEIRKTRKVKQVLTQSTISPFLVKKNRKEPETDDFDLVGVTPMEVSNITLAAEKEEGDDVIFTPLPVEKLPTNTMQRKGETEPESIKNNNFDDVIFTPLPVEKLPTKTMQRKEPESIKNNNSDVIFTPLPVQKLPTKNLQRKEPESIKNNFDDVIFTPLQVEKNPQKDSRPQNDLNFNVFSKPPRIQEEPIPKRPPMTTNVSIAEINEKKTDFSKLDFRKSEDFNVFPNRKPKMLTRQLLEDSEPRLKPPQKEPEIEIYEPGKLRNLLPNDRISWQPESVKNEFEDYESRILPPGFEKASTLNRTKNGGGGGEFEDTRRKIVDKFSRNIHGPRNAATKRVLPQKDNSKIVTEFFKSVKHLKQSEEEFNNKSRKIEIVAPTQITLQNQDDQIIEDEEEEEEIQEEPIIDRRNLGNPMNNTIELDGMKECRRWKIGGYESPAQNIETNDILPTWNPDVLTYKFTEYQPSSSNQPVKIEPSFTAPKKNKKNNLVHKPIARLSENVQIYRTPLVKRVPSAENSAIYTEELCKRLANLNIVPLRDALETRKYWMMSKIVVIMPTFCRQMYELQSDGVDWNLKMQVSDTSVSNVICLVSTDLLDRIFGFTVSQCKKLFDESKIEILRQKKMEAERKLAGFRRLDLIMSIEISPQNDKIPLIIDVKTISDALNVL